MNSFYEYALPIEASLGDFEGKMSLTALFAAFMDAAARHANDLGLGASALAARNMQWVAVGTKARIYRRPRMMSETVMRTWPNTPGHVRCERCYRLSDAAGVLAEGRTEWAIVKMDSGSCAAQTKYIRRKWNF